MAEQGLLISRRLYDVVSGGQPFDHAGLIRALGKARLVQLNAQARDSQRKTEQLSEKLEALKTIERTLPASPATPGPAASASSAKQGG